MFVRTLAGAAVVMLLATLEPSEGGVASVAPGSAQTTAAEVAYRFTYDEARFGIVSIAIDWAEPLTSARSLVIPRAIPMGYGEQRYDAFVRNMQGIVAGKPVALEREEGPRWKLPVGATGVAYHVNLVEQESAIKAASDQSRPRNGYLGVLGYSVFAFVDGFESRRARLHIDGPDGWPIFATLGPTWPVRSRPLDVRADDYYALADGQIVMGPHASVRRLAERPVPLYLASYAEGPVDLDRVGRLVTTAFQRIGDYFGTAPFASYTVHQELLKPLTAQHEYGMSMEHLSSSTYYLAASTGLTAASPPDEELRVLYNFAHHMAHAWVPKRTYGLGYFPFQWELAPVIDSIWFAEGFGQYAAIMALAPSMPDPAAFRERMLERRFRSNTASAPAFLKRLPLVDLSRVASTRYAEDFRTGRLVFSRGGLMAAAIDDRIQSETRGARSLRDALRFMVEWTARERRGFGNDELANLIRQATGVETRAIIDELLRPMPD